MRIASILLVALLAGCLGDGDLDSTAVTSASEGPSFGAMSGLPDVPAARSTQESPKWVAGEWWRVKATSYSDGEEWEVTRVVAGREGDQYLVGMPTESFVDDIMILHLPSMGIIDMDTQEADVHDFRFRPLEFPLTPGDSWTTDFHGDNDLTAIVESVTDQTAHITMSGQYGIDIHYDAALGTMKVVDVAGYGRYEVIDHGYNFEGSVTVPYSHDIAVFSGRLAGVVDPSHGVLPPTAGAPAHSAVVADGYDRMSFALLTGDFVSQGALPTDPGAYHIEVTAPDGSNYASTRLPAEGPGGKVEAYSIDNPGGEWQIMSVAAGPGMALLEGVAYQVYEATLPHGCARTVSTVYAFGGSCPV